MGKEYSNFEIAEGWISDMSVNEGVVDPRRESPFFDILDSHIYSSPPKSWDIIKIISQKELSPWVMENFSAGPLSSFIYRNGKKFQVEIKDFYRKNKKFRDCYGGIVFTSEAQELLKQK